MGAAQKKKKKGKKKKDALGPCSPTAVSEAQLRSSTGGGVFFFFFFLTGAGSDPASKMTA